MKKTRYNAAELAPIKTRCQALVASVERIAKTARFSEARKANKNASMILLETAVDLGVQLFGLDKDMATAGIKMVLHERARELGYDY